MNNYKQVIRDLEDKYKNINVVKNDIVAFQKFKNYNMVYNKFQIAVDQNLKCGICPIIPDEYPVVLKPIYNLIGMGIDSIKIKSKKEFLKNSKNGNFWTKFLVGNHISWDLIIRDGIIIYHVPFHGHKKTFGTFNYWEEIYEEIPKNVRMLVNKYFKNFTGNVNMETIGNKVIEVHLRMGDIDLVDYDIIKLSVLNQIEKNDEEIIRQMKIINSKKKKIKNIYLVPVWEKLDIKSSFTKQKNLLYKKYEYIKQLQDILEDDDLIEGYYIDDPEHPNPIGYKRWFLLLSKNLKDTIKLKNKFERLIKNHQV
tara:strand:- start:1332 stop:2261 length:930 start_codon:yes stop_codon:yes gene_type:complete